MSFPKQEPLQKQFSFLEYVVRKKGVSIVSQQQFSLPLPLEQFSLVYLMIIVMTLPIMAVFIYLSVPSSKLLANTWTIACNFIGNIFRNVELQICHCLLPRPERKCLAQVHQLIFVPKAGSPGFYSTFEAQTLSLHGY